MDNVILFCEIWESFEQTCFSENLHQFQDILLSEENKKIIMNSIIQVISSIPENSISQSEYDQIYRRVYNNYI
jgi:hypothetical protein